MNPPAKFTSSPTRLAAEFAGKCNLQDATRLARFPGSKMERSNFAHPFLDRKMLGVLADYVTMDHGHRRGSHRAFARRGGLRHRREVWLDVTSNVDEKGIMRNGLPEYDGLKVWAANAPIIELLKKRGALMHTEKLVHSYPHCWRCHNPIIFRATEQWFISMEAPMPGGGTLRSRTLEDVEKVKWDPAWGKERMHNMIATRPDWCISRQRVWGVPIAVFLCEGCGKPLNDPAHQSPKWSNFSPAPAPTPGTRPQADAISFPRAPSARTAAHTTFERETDILRRLAGIRTSHLALLDDEPGYPWPSDLYLEGGDQYRGWFQSSLLCAMGTRGNPPYRGVVTPGWTLDEKGQAMSKSRGNDVDPVDIANRLGGEIVRLWVASVDFREDVVGSEQLMQRVAESYRKIRNSLFRYVLSNLYDFDPQKNAVPFEEMDMLDQYMLRQTVAMSADVIRWYDEFAFHKIYHRINDFCVVELSAFYFDVLKDRLYTSAPNSRCPPRGADRDLAHRRSPGSPAGAHHQLHLRRSLAVSARAARPSGQRASGELPRCI